MKIKLKLRRREEEEAAAETPELMAPPPSKRMKIVIKKSGLRMSASSFYIPKGHKLKPLGEDAHFISADNQTIGVADGVGGWAHQGIDSGVFARALMAAAAEEAAVQSSSSSGGVVEPKRLLQEAFPKTAGIEGASTACILSHSDGVLRCANLGDSGFMLFRNGKLLHRSEPQQRRFNCPFQLGNHANCERPDCAADSQLSVAAGDLVVLATDGLLDNMFDSDIEAIVGKANSKGGMKKKNGYSAKVEEYLAWKLAEEAYHKSRDKYFASPFAISSAIAGKKHQGGKVDDITVVVAKIATHYELHCRT